MQNIKMPPLDKVQGAVRTSSDKIEDAGVRLTVGDAATLGQLVDRLGEEGHRHSARIPAPEARLLIEKIIMQWPADRLVAAVDLLRVMTLFFEA